MASASYLFQLTPSTPDSDARSYVRVFAAQGHTIQAYSSLDGLINHISSLPDGRDHQVVVIIDGREPSCPATVSALRALQANLGIVAIVGRDDDAAMARLLLVGVDMCCFVCASPDLLLATALRLQLRLGQHSRLHAGQGQRSNSWQLADDGWLMQTPIGVSITLTTGERAFLMTLFESPSKQATHAELIDAVNAAYKDPEGPIHRGRLVVMISRMRRKFTQAGAPLPLKSIHNWGYMFVVNDRISRDPTVLTR